MTFNEGLKLMFNFTIVDTLTGENMGSIKADTIYHAANIALSTRGPIVEATEIAPGVFDCLAWPSVEAAENDDGARAVYRGMLRVTQND